LIAAQRAAGEAFAGTLKPQLTPSAARPILPAAKAALVALMQNNSSAAADISMISLMAGPSQNNGDIGFSGFHYITKPARVMRNKIGPVLA
jgi:hypothetical protein